MDYTTLVADETTQGSIKYWINYSRIDATGILSEAQAWIYQRIRLLQMIAEDDVSIASGASTASKPTGYLDPVHLAIPGYIHSVPYRDPETFRAALGWDTSAELPEGTPTFWSDINDQMQFNTKADQAYTAKFVFFKQPDDLASDNLTNFLTNRYPTLLRRVCIMFAAEARKEYDLMDRHEARALRSIEEIKIENDLGMRGMELDMHWMPTDG